MSDTEALADALVYLDALERDATGASIGPLVPDTTLYLCSVGVLDHFNFDNPELLGLTDTDIASNPGVVVRIVGVVDLTRWPDM